MKRERVVVYIDGGNLYHGLKGKGWQHYCWLDLWELSKNLLKPWQDLVNVRYFISKIRQSGDSDKEQERRDQNVYLKVLESLSGVDIHYGEFKIRKRKCFFCGKKLNCEECKKRDKEIREKMTDVNIAVKVFGDAIRENFDTAIIISGDSDFVPLAEGFPLLYPEKRLFFVFPPDRSLYDLENITPESFTIYESILKKSQFQYDMCGSDGKTYLRPLKWRKGR